MDACGTASTLRCALRSIAAALQPVRHCRGPKMTPYWMMLAGSIFASMAGNTMLKLGARMPSFLAQLLDWRSIAGLALYGGGALLYMVALRRIPMSVALPFTAVAYIVAALIGHYGFGEDISLMHMAAIALIVGGVVLLAFS